MGTDLSDSRVLKSPPAYKRVHTVAAVLLIVCQPLLFFRKVLFSATKHIPYDYLTWHFPLSSFLARSVRNHAFPWWDPISYCGYPIHADIQAQLFYPITWIALLFGKLGQSIRSYYFYEWLDPVHMIFAGLFAFFLLRRLRCSPAAALLGASTYQLGAFFASQAQHLGAICCAAWLPLAIWSLIELAERASARWTGLLALAVALTVLSGFPDAVFASVASVGLLALVLLLYRIGRPKFLALVAAGMLLGVLICSVQLLPALQLSRLSVASLRSAWYPVHVGLPFASLLSFAVPNYLHIFEGGTSAYTFPYNFTLLYTFCGHIPILLLLLSPVSRKSRYFAGFSIVGAFSLLWMLGDKVYLSKLICVFLPASVKGALYCVDGLMPFTLLIGVLAALSLSSLELRFSSNAISIVVWLIALTSSAELLWLSSDRPFNASDGSYRQLNSEHIFEGDPSVVSSLTSLLSVAVPPLRTDSAVGENAALRSASEIFMLPTANGDNPSMSLRYFHFRDVFAKTTARERMKLLSSLDSLWIDALNIGAVEQSLYSKPLPPPEHPEKWETVTLSGIRLYRNKSPLPRFYLVNHVLRVRDPDEAEVAIKNTEFAPALWAVVEGLDANWHAANSTAGGEVDVISYSNNAVDLLVTAPGPLYLVTSEAYYPGWKAAVNGVTTALYPTNLAFRGLPVPAGVNHITLSYAPENIVWWLSLSLCSLAGALLLICKPGLRA